MKRAIFTLWLCVAACSQSTPATTVSPTPEDIEYVQLIPEFVGGAAGT